MEKTLIIRKGKYSIYGEVNLRTKRIYNFSVAGPGVDRRVTYTYLPDAERIVNHFTAQKN